MIIYIIKPIWWAFRFFIAAPIVHIVFLIFAMMFFLWDYKKASEINLKEELQFPVARKHETVEDMYTTWWHYLLGYPPISSRIPKAEQQWP